MSDLSSAALSPQIQDAVRSGDKLLLSVLRLLSTSLKNAEIEKRGDLSEDEAIAIVAKEVRRRQEAAAEYEKGGRPDRAEAEMAEAEVLRRWLPAQLSEEELASLVEEAVAASGASGPQQMGQVMKILSPKVKGRADGKVVSDLVRAKLSG